MDEMEELQNLLADLNSNQLFTAFVSLGGKFVNLDGGAMTYNKTAHLAAFAAMNQAFNEFIESHEHEDQEDEKDLKNEIDQLTGENES